MTCYIMKRKLRHIQSIGIYNVYTPLNKDTTTNFIKTHAYFFTIETTKGDIIYVSETQQTTLCNVQFNEINFDGCPLDRFILKIFTEYPLAEPLRLNLNKKNEKWNQVSLYSINLNNLNVIDINKLSSVKDIIIPILKMSDGYFLPNQFKLGIQDHNNQLANYNSSTIKKSFNYNSLIKLNKLVEYQKQLNQDKLNLSKSIENCLSDYKFKEFIEERLKIIKGLIETTKLRLSKKRAKIKSLNLELSKSKIPTSLPFKKQNSNVTIEQDEYGNTYSNLIQLKDKIGKIKSKKIQHLIAIFNNIPFINNTDINFFQIITNKSPNNMYEYTLKLFNIDFDHILTLSQESREKRIKTNTQLGSYVLLLLLISNKILNIQIPFNMSYYGSTSMINFHYPLFITHVQSTKHLNEFKLGINLLNININQINQFLQN